MAKLADLIWKNAELLRGAFKENEYRKVSFIADAPVRSCSAGLVRVLAPPVLEVATGADLQYLASQRDRPLCLVSRDPGVLHRDSLAKYAVAFFRI